MTLIALARIQREHLKKSLSLDDEKKWHKRWQEELNGQYEIISAFSLEEAEEKFAQHQGEFAAIVLDACVPGHQPTTMCLAMGFRFSKNFTGPMIAVSSLEDYRLELMLHGCNFESTKTDLPRKLLEIFQPQPAAL